MNNENLKKIEQQIERVFAAAGISPEQFDEFKKRLAQKKKDEDRKILAVEIAQELAKVIKIPSNEPIIKAIKDIKIETKTPIVKVPNPKIIVREAVQPKIIVPEPKVVVRAQETKGLSELLKKLLEALKKRQEVILPKGTIPVELEYEGEKYRGMGGGGGPSRVFIKNSDNQTISPIGETGSPTVYNVAMATANTEYSKTLPSGVKRFIIGLRGINASLKLAVDDGLSGTTYFTLPYGVKLPFDNVNLTSTTLYLQSSSASQVCEILALFKA